MEYIIGAISLTSLLLNFLVYKKIKASEALTAYQELSVEYIEPEIREAEVEEVLPPVEQHVTIQQVEDVYNGWRNQKGISWSGPTSAPLPPLPPKVRGPLERPDGFV